jgi:hypothetical protein
MQFYSGGYTYSDIEPLVQLMFNFNEDHIRHRYLWRKYENGMSPLCCILSPSSEPCTLTFLFPTNSCPRCSRMGRTLPTRSGGTRDFLDLDEVGKGSPWGLFSLIPVLVGRSWLESGLAFVSVNLFGAFEMFVPRLFGVRHRGLEIDATYIFSSRDARLYLTLLSPFMLLDFCACLSRSGKTVDDGVLANVGMDSDADAYQSWVSSGD